MEAPRGRVSARAVPRGPCLIAGTREIGGGCMRVGRNWLGAQNLDLDLDTGIQAQVQMTLDDLTQTTWTLDDRHTTICPGGWARSSACSEITSKYTSRMLKIDSRSYHSRSRS